MVTLNKHLCEKYKVKLFCKITLEVNLIVTIMYTNLDPS